MRCSRTIFIIGTTYRSEGDGFLNLLLCSTSYIDRSAFRDAYLHCYQGNPTADPSDKDVLA